MININKSGLFVIACLLISGYMARAKDLKSQIIGTWQLKKMQCASGVHPLKDTTEWEFVDGLLIFRRGHDAGRGINLLCHVPDFTFENLEDDILLVKESPDMKGRAFKLAELTSLLAVEKLYRSGGSCDGSGIELNYSLTGAQLTFSFAKQGYFRMSCGAGHIDVASTDLDDNYTVAISKRTLTLTDNAKSGGNRICPRGDHEIFSYARVK